MFWRRSRCLAAVGTIRAAAASRLMVGSRDDKGEPCGLRALLLPACASSERRTPRSRSLATSARFDSARRTRGHRLGEHPADPAMSSSAAAGRHQGLEEQSGRRATGPPCYHPADAEARQHTRHRAVARASMAATRFSPLVAEPSRGRRSSTRRVYRSPRRSQPLGDEILRRGGCRNRRYPWHRATPNARCAAPPGRGRRHSRSRPPPRPPPCAHRLVADGQAVGGS